MTVRELSLIGRGSVRGREGESYRGESYRDES